MDIDFSSLWTWTLPLWGLFLIVLFLAGVLSDTVILQGYPRAAPAPSLASALASLPAPVKQVRFSLPVPK